MPFGADDIPDPDAWREFGLKIVEIFKDPSYTGPFLVAAVAGAVFGFGVAWLISEGFEHFDIDVWSPIVYGPSMTICIAVAVWLVSQALPPVIVHPVLGGS